MFRWNSHAAMAAFLLVLLSMDAVLGGIVQMQRARLPNDDDNLLGESKPSEVPLRKTQELKDESSSQTALVEKDSKVSDSEPKREDVLEPARAAEFPNDDFFNNDLFDNIRLRKESQEEQASEAVDAVAYVAGAAASFLARPIINSLPPNFNKAIVGLASVIDSFSKNSTQKYPTPEYPVNRTSYDTKASSRQARDFPAYGFDGVVSTAVAWMNGENMANRDSIAPSAEEFAPYSSLRGPEAARLGVVDPLLSVLGAVKRAIATEFLSVAVVMAVAHIARIFFVNLPAMLPIFGVSRTNSRRDLTPDKPLQVDESLDPSAPSAVGTKTGNLDLVKQAELLAREVVAAVTRDQCAERAACLMGAHCSQYSITPSVMRLLRSPEPNKEKPDHPVWLAFRDAAERRAASDNCDQLYTC